MPILPRRALLVAGISVVMLLAACGAKFRTYYDNSVPAEVSRGWHISQVAVSVPDSLKVSEAKSLLPAADIVWREDPEGDRRPQVAAIIKTAAEQGSRTLRGPRAVRLEITVSRFHALTFEAEKRMENAGVHNVDFTIQAVDAATGAVLAGPEKIEAAFPALSGKAMAAARAQGQTQKSMIIAHTSRVIAGWLGVGPDPRETFTRMGG
ncbi:MAG: hypothetical protein DI533_01965 [Cereibacter sphaeroides]|uniref:Lipoprotein n=1 Tax=Cereibacter sphaeroides TaxID=1063 RepID=A0A2W5U7R2_CERSP|nr:MAG: hypothetical protein DI533_01965 [Cereibacter sphaeroides]